MTKVWLIMCRFRGLVHALAEAVLASGHKLVAITVDAEPLIELAERHGDRLSVLPIEVTDASAIRATVEATVGAFGRIDVVVTDLGCSSRGATPWVAPIAGAQHFEGNPSI